MQGAGSLWHRDCVRNACRVRLQCCRSCAGCASLPHCCNEMQLRGKGGKESEPARSSEKETKEGSEQRRVWDGAAGSSEESLRSYCTATALHGTSLGHPQSSVPAQTMSVV